LAMLLWKETNSQRYFKTHTYLRNLHNCTFMWSCMLWHCGHISLKPAAFICSMILWNISMHLQNHKGLQARLLCTCATLWVSDSCFLFMHCFMKHLKLC
jgi:hypothetical protein